MKNKLLAVFIICFILICCFTGCNAGTYFENGKKTPPTDIGGGNGPVVGPENPSGPTEENPTHYTATLYLGSSVFTPDDSMKITVVWRSKNSVVRVPLGEDGKADAGELDGTYSVYLTGLPNTYTYNPNGYVATADEKKVSILLTTVRSPESGNGSSMYVNNGCFTVRDDGTYRATVSREGAALFYEYRPRSAGVYSIESWINVYDDEINPLFHLYAGNIGSKWFLRTLDGGGAEADGGFAKNFRYEFAVSATEVGNVCTFAVGAVSKSQEYPVYVDFAITYLGEYTSSYADVRPQAAKQARGKTQESKDLALENSEEFV